MKLRLGIVGHGFVGKAVEFGFSNPNVEKFIVDPKYDGVAVATDGYYSDIEKLKTLDPHLTFVCVPTPMGKDGKIDSSIVEKVVKELKEYTTGLIVIKSTVTPDIIIKLATEGYGSSRIIYNPEFLTEKAANEDFVNPELHVFGGVPGNTKRLHDFYIKYSNCKPCPVHYMSAVDASFVKYGINSYLASKVLWFNQFYDVIENFNGNYSVVLNAMLSDSRIGQSHTSVPGFDGKRGFGGACFPKDTNAFYNFDKSFTVLREVIAVNNALRSSYEKDARELEQNVSYET